MKSGVLQHDVSLKDAAGSFFRSTQQDLNEPAGAPSPASIQPWITSCVCILASKVAMVTFSFDLLV